MKNIAIIAVCDFINNPIGGEVFLLHNLLKNAPPKSINISLIGMSFNSKDKLGQWSKKNIDGILYDYLPVSKISKSSILPYRLKVVLGIKKYFNLIKEKNINTIYIHSAELILPFLKKKNINVIYHIHGNPEVTLKISRFPLFRLSIFSKMYCSFINKTIKRSEIIVWAAEKNKKEYIINNPPLKDMIINKSITIHSSFDTSLKYKNFTNLYEFHSNKKYLITVGRLNKGKRIDFLLDVFHHLSKTHDNINFIICGDGEEKQNLANKAIELNISNKVTFMGAINRDKLGFLLCNSDLFVFASEYEALSLVVLESLYMGTPVVTTEVGDLPIIIQNNITGEVVSTNDKENFISAINKALTLGKEHYSQSCIATAENFSPEKMSNKIYLTLEGN